MAQRRRSLCAKGMFAGVVFGILCAAFSRPTSAQAASPRASARGQAQPAERAARLAAYPPPPAPSFELEPFGDVFVSGHMTAAKRLFLFISGDGGWRYGVLQVAAALVSMPETIVVGVDINAYRKRVHTRDVECTDFARDLDLLGNVIRARYHISSEVKPLLIGYSSGASLVYGALAEAPAETFAGAVSLGFCPTLAASRPLCLDAQRMRQEPKPRVRGTRLAPVASLSAPWVVFQGMTDTECPYAIIQDFVERTPRGALVPSPDRGHSLEVTPEWQAMLTRELMSRFPSTIRAQ